ncbi:MAG: DUF3306 domain-containing protein [Paracoccaceae bacterium]
MSDAQNFWARRKAAVAAEANAEHDALEAKAFAEDQKSFDDLSDAEILQHFDLPDPDHMKLGDDFSAFMAKAVPDRIRRRALRVLWRSNPVLANVDMLVDYGEDFTDKATVVENMQTAYQIGKGMLKHVEEMARQAEERENPPEPDDLEDTDFVLADDRDVGDQALACDTPPPASDQIDTLDAPEEVAFAIPTPRRMTFRTEESAA